MHRWTHSTSQIQIWNDIKRHMVLPPPPHGVESGHLVRNATCSRWQFCHGHAVWQFLSITYVYSFHWWCGNPSLPVWLPPCVATSLYDTTHYPALYNNKSQRSVRASACADPGRILSPSWETHGPFPLPFFPTPLTQPHSHLFTCLSIAPKLKPWTWVFELWYFVMCNMHFLPKFLREK